ncbi:MAG TPA: potassium channel protein [Egibacteraceae bacterium]|nr:potassium channel protein [Actinomycetota bacterium]HWB72489.1 potassium channel protein [Egibacteraceae bacterium]
MPAIRRLAVALGLFAIVIVGGTAGYMVLGGARLLDALYMTVISVSTVGFGEVIPLDDAGRILTMAVVVLGLGSVTFAALTIIDFLVEGHLQAVIERRRMDRQLQALEDHTIVCGFGRVGRQTIEALTAEGRPVVVVDSDPARLHLAAQRGLPYVEGDASHEDQLRGAGIERARALVACTADDAENVLISLTAKGLNPRVLIIARVKAEENAAKARQAGADRVITPTAIGGRRIAALVARPYVVDFLDVVTHGTDVDVVLEEVAVMADSPLAGLTLREASLRERYGANVLAIRHGSDGGTNTHPTPEDALHVGDVLVLIGRREELDRLLVDARATETPG